jgi:hypothetical protein
MLGKTLSALAEIECARGRGDAAIRLVRDSLRYAYLAGDVEGIAIGYHNLGNYLTGHSRQPVPAFISHLTAAFICTLIGNDDASESVEAAATDLRAFRAGDVPPASVADLCRQVGDIPGTNLPDLTERLCPDPAAAERALRDLITQAQELATASQAEDGPDPGPAA